MVRNLQAVESARFFENVILGLPSVYLIQPEVNY